MHFLQVSSTAATSRIEISVHFQSKTPNYAATHFQGQAKATVANHVDPSSVTGGAQVTRLTKQRLADKGMNGYKSPDLKRRVSLCPIHLPQYHRTML